MAKADDLQAEALDLWMYKLAADSLGKTANDAEFEAGYAEQKFHFSQDPALLSDLLVKHSIRLLLLGGEWLASTETESAYGETPLIAACRVVIKRTFGENLDK